MASMANSVIADSAKCCHANIVGALELQAVKENWSADRLQQEIEIAQKAKKLFLNLSGAMVSDVLQERRCFVCDKQVEKMKSCPRCLAIFYCSRDCQKADWQAHKKVCSLKPRSASS